MAPCVVVLGGGVSVEHEVSLVSATEVVSALHLRGRATRAIWVDPAGRWHLCPLDYEPPRSARADSLRRVGRCAPALPAATALGRLAAHASVCVFPALHGAGGEDGSVQALCEQVGVAYVGSGPAASALAMSKATSRLVFSGAGLPMAPAWVPRRAEAREADAAAVAQGVARAGLSYPLYLKADRSGSSLGLARVGSAADLEAALETVREVDDYWIAEEAVAGTELTCAILDDAGSAPRALPPVEIRPRHASFFDYEAKYDSSATEECCPPRSLDASGIRAVETLALEAHEILGCRSISRSDMILGDDGLALLETNTMPGLTPQSLVPRAAREAGLSFAGLVERLVDRAAVCGGRAGEDLTPRARASAEGETEWAQSAS